jgi:hypothetical protein
MTNLEKVQEAVNTLDDNGKNPERSKISDGYHTFGELYEHRLTLYIALCKALWAVESMASQTDSIAQQMLKKSPREKEFEVWRSKTHSDGSTYDGWFIMGINKDKGEQISYHLPLELWDETDFAETLEKAPEWDGHTAADVLERISSM